jgi:hypothetical protein
VDKVPYELKLSYTGKRLSSLGFFAEKYKKEGKIITLDKKDEDKRLFFPREV